MCVVRVLDVTGMDPRLLSDSRKRVGEFDMSKLMTAVSTKGHETVHGLFAAGGPVLIEVRIPGGIYTSDWHLCDSEYEFDELLEKIRPEAVLHVNRVWDLSNRAGSLCLRRGA